jgi:hypothetical protein
MMKLVHHFTNNPSNQRYAKRKKMPSALNAVGYSCMASLMARALFVLKEAQLNKGDNEFYEHKQRWMTTCVS